ncbi:MAG TPA: hypothetical protein VGR61_05615 [Candidatus Dormibacteraeota bacterium]|nr:hypothetical protein [Candidatus Dormibacteraeota bacterium]
MLAVVAPTPKLPAGAALDYSGVLLGLLLLGLGGIPVALRARRS